MTCAIFRLLAQNNAWANARLLGASTQLGPGEWEAPRTGFFPSLKETCLHIYEVDLFYIDALTEAGMGRRIYSETVLPDTAQGLATAQDSADQSLIAFCEADPDPSRKVNVERKESMTLESIGDLLLHLFQHQIHHRGQAHTMLSRTSVKPPQLDEFHLAIDENPANPPGRWGQESRWLWPIRTRWHRSGRPFRSAAGHR